MDTNLYQTHGVDFHLEDTIPGGSNYDEFEKLVEINARYLTWDRQEAGRMRERSRSELVLEIKNHGSIHVVFAAQQDSHEYVGFGMLIPDVLQRQNILERRFIAEEYGRQGISEEISDSKKIGV